ARAAPIGRDLSPFRRNCNDGGRRDSREHERAQDSRAPDGVSSSVRCRAKGASTPNLILRSVRRTRLEGWPRVLPVPPSFETLASQAPQDEVWFPGSRAAMTILKRAALRRGTN